MRAPDPQPARVGPAPSPGLGLGLGPGWRPQRLREACRRVVIFSGDDVRLLFSCHGLRMSRLSVPLLLLALLLAACGGDGDGGNRGAPLGSASPTPATTPTPRPGTSWWKGHGQPGVYHFRR